MNYCELKNIVKNNQFINCKTKIIGKSVLGKHLYAFMFCNNPQYRWAIVTAGIHAREHLSCDLVVKLMQDFSSNGAEYGYNIAFVPLVNPDGANLCITGTKNLKTKFVNNLLKINGSNNFSLYKANANGVDLNNNFGANWNIKFTIKKSASSQGFYGKKPFSEPESLALAKFTQKLKPFITISYHLKGEEIYFDFFQPAKRYFRDLHIAQVFAYSTGYKIVSTQAVSSGGYKDWCVQKLKIPSLTIELGNDEFNHPYPESEIDNIYDKNKGLFECLQKSLNIYNFYYGETYGLHGNCNKLRKKSIQKRRGANWCCCCERWKGYCKSIQQTRTQSRCYCTCRDYRN